MEPQPQATGEGVPVSVLVERAALNAVPGGTLTATGLRAWLLDAGFAQAVGTTDRVMPTRAAVELVEVLRF